MIRYPRGLDARNFLKGITGKGGLRQGLTGFPSSSQRMGPNINTYTGEDYPSFRDLKQQPPRKSK